MIQIEDFDKVELRVGTIVQASINKRHESLLTK